MIKLESIEKVYRTEQVETLALSNINFAVDEGEFISVMGPSGSGKSTLLNVIGLLDEPTGGDLSLNGRHINSYADRYLARIRNEEVGFIFQSFHLIADLNVVDNVEIPLLYRRGLSGKERRQMALKALDRVGLSSRVKHFPSQLSGGQQQRVAVARAIVAQPHILLADEPTGNLDSQMGDEIMGIMHQLNEEGTTIVMVTHDQRLADRTGRTVRLFDGRQVQ
ncbi:MAG: ABC transporter ATP-binding protein [Gemmatimonadota bacterium]|nr:ABC transporter ATP-binding protein [Gemmatimonadota bacterium]